MINLLKKQTGDETTVTADFSKSAKPAISQPEIMVTRQLQNEKCEAEIRSTTLSDVHPQGSRHILRY